MYHEQPTQKISLAAFSVPRKQVRNPTSFRLTFLVLLFLGFVLPLAAKEPEAAPDQQPMETGDSWETPFFSGIVIEPREFVPRVKVPQVEEPVEREEISFYSDVRNYILQVEEENTHRIYPRKKPNQK